jgi:hypothetical protein
MASGTVVGFMGLGAMGIGKSNIEFSIGCRVFLVSVLETPHHRFDRLGGSAQSIKRQTLQCQKILNIQYIVIFIELSILFIRMCRYIRTSTCQGHGLPRKERGRIERGWGQS